MKDFAARDKLITSHYVAGKKLTDIMRLFGLRSPGHVRIIARRTGAPPRKNGRPRHAAN
jgi:hypothetical protein